jgi:uroporphyrinogen-III synthase
MIGDDTWTHLQDVPVYSVGPATTRVLKAISRRPSLQVFGDHTGNGDALAHFILGHYGDLYHDRPTKPALLFLVGKQRRDVIPKTLMQETLEPERRIQVDEIVVYGTEVAESFKHVFEQILADTEGRQMRWVIVFSPAGCNNVLRGLHMLDEETGKAKAKDPQRTTYVATIGPTTRDYLRRTFDFEPDVCSEEPNPEGIMKGITGFIETLRRKKSVDFA